MTAMMRAAAIAPVAGSLLAILLCAAGPSLAQAAPPYPAPSFNSLSVHTPRETIQPTPMRVSVLDGRSFRDEASVRPTGFTGLRPASRAKSRSWGRSVGPARLFRRRGWSRPR